MMVVTNLDIDSRRLLLLQILGWWSVIDLANNTLDVLQLIKILLIVGSMCPRWQHSSCYHGIILTILK